MYWEQFAYRRNSHRRKALLDVLLISFTYIARLSQWGGGGFLPAAAAPALEEGGRGGGGVSTEWGNVINHVKVKEWHKKNNFSESLLPFFKEKLFSSEQSIFISLSELLFAIPSITILRLNQANYLIVARFFFTYPCFLHFDGRGNSKIVKTI